MNKDKIVPYIFISPFIFSFVIFFLFPALYSLGLSFFNYRGFGEARFVGFDNFINILQYKTFWTSVYNTLFYLFFHWIPVIIISFILALVVRTRSLILQRFLKPLIFLPHMMAIVAASLVWRVIFSTRHGVINVLLGTQIPFLDDPRLMKWSVVVLMLWKSIGWFFVVFLAGLTTISDEVREAAKIDGASNFKTTLYVIIPIMKPIFLFTFLMETINTLKIYTQPNLLISGWLSAPVQAKPIMSIVIDNMKTGFFGMACAAGWLLFLGILLVSLVQLKLFKNTD